MSERTREKPVSQDALGLVLLGIGGFFAVSIVLFSLGQSPKPGLIQQFTALVVELVALLGTAGAGLFALGLSALGTFLFLRASATSPVRPLFAVLALALGASLLLGALEWGGELGAWLPGLVGGVAGKILTAVLGAALVWLGWMLVAPERGGSGGSVSARLNAFARQEAAGVSSAEAALLSSDRQATVRPAPRREEPRARPERSTRIEETVRPFKPAPEARLAPAPAPVKPPVRVPDAPRPIPPLESQPLEAEAPPAPPPAPSWEDVEESFPVAVPEERAEEPEESELLARDLAEVFDVDDEEADELEESEPEEPFAPAPPSPVPSAAWEQSGLFDEARGEELAEEVEEVEESESEEEESEEREEREEARPAEAQAGLTPSFDFDSLEPRRPAHEPDPVEDPFAAPPSVAIQAPAPAPVKAEAIPAEPEPEAEPEPREPEVEAKPARKRSRKAPREKEVAQDFLLQPSPPPAPREAEGLASDEESARWSQLVFDAGCAILEQNRVAVSMLERRFGIDFDQACRVLDELQQAGLIGPYLGGRTRDILLSREAWQAHAPHARESL